MAGEIIHYAGSTPPAGYLVANGQLISRSTYAALFAAIGVVFGPGDGSTTFAVPDLRGEFVRGADVGRGVDTGRALGSLQNGAFQEHYHSLDVINQAIGFSNQPSQGGTYPPAQGNSTNYGTATSNTRNSNAGGAGETRPRNVALLPCIAY